jgi:amino acid adenylation domain-containing protein
MDGVPYQVIEPEVTFALDVVDLSMLPEERQPAAVSEFIKGRGRERFVLERAPLLRASVVKLVVREHLLVLAVHHIVIDGWSWGILARELTELYEALIAGRAATLEPLPCQYADYALWQRSWLTEARVEQHLSYWRDRLSGAPPSLDLAADRARPAVQSFRGAMHDFFIPRPLSDKLADLGRRCGATLFMLLTAAFKIVLSRHSGQDDILIGTPVANRSRKEIEGVIGLFLNTLVLRTDLSGDPTFTELIRRVRETTLGAFRYQDLSFEKLVEALQPVRDLSRSPVVQVMINLLPPVREARLPSLKASYVTVDLETSKFDLTLIISRLSNGLGARLEYSTDLFDQETISAIADHFEVVLQALVDDPDQPISRVPCLTSAEHQRVLHEWNRTERTYAPDPLQQLFVRSAATTPEAVAIVCAEKHITYGELDRKSNQLAHYVSRLGIGPESIVGIGIDRSIEMVIALLGVLKAGATYLPLDLNYPADRLNFMVEDAKVSLVLMTSDDASVLGLDRIQVVDLNVQCDAIAACPITALGVAVTTRSLAYVIYTSGSTGQPKGVMITHGSLVNFLSAMSHHVDATDVVMAVTPLSFDIAGLELFLALVRGARIVIASRATSSDGVLLGDQLSEHKVTVLQATPATWYLLLASGWLPRSGLKMLCGGEAMPLQIARTLGTSNASLINMYGPTETTIWSTSYDVCGSEDETVPIGRPIANTQAYVLDRCFRPVPVGMPGELFIAGEGLARGYLNRPDLTAESFVPNPFTAKPGARMYRTGDQVRYRRDGNLEFLGRLDQQVKIRGYRIELGEVEAALSRHPDVKQAVVITQGNAVEDRRLVAFIVPEKERLASESDLRSILTGRLPEYMMPTSYAFLEEVPLTRNGKVDRSLLAISHSEVPRGSSRTLSAVELRVADIWKGIFGPQADLGPHSDFFQLGGNSLSAVYLASRLRSEFSLSISLRHIFQSSQLETLAASIEAMMVPVGH